MKKKWLFLLNVCLGFVLLTMQVQAQNRLVGPAQGTGAVRKISPNGRYVVGTEAAGSGVARGFVWDTQSGNNITYLPTVGVAYNVTDDRFIVGIFTDSKYKVKGSAILSGGYVRPGENAWTSLGLGLMPPDSINSSEGSAAHGISADGKTIVGYSCINQQESEGVFSAASSWTENAQGEWICEEWAHPENLRQSYILDIADNGKAVGFIYSGTERQGILWNSKDQYEIPLGKSPVNGELYSEYMCISKNGKYAGLNYNGQTSGHAGVQNLETREISMIPEGAVLLNSVSNDGFAVGVYRPTGDADKAFIWSKKLGFMDFGDFVSQFMSDVSIPYILREAFKTTNGDSYWVNSITPDGLNFAIQLTTASAPRTAQAYVLRLAAPITIFPFAKNLSAVVAPIDRNKVVLSWEAPDLEGETLTEYAIYRDARTTPIARIAPDLLTYTDTVVPTGYHTYKIRAVYGSSYSGVSNTVQVAIVDTYDLPFHEDFKSLSLATNYWTASVEKDAQDVNPHVYWGAYDNVGVQNSFGLILGVNNYYGLNNTEFAASLTSKYLDGKDAENVYLSFLVRPNYYFEPELTPDTLFIDVFDGEKWTNVNKSVFLLVMEWKAEILDLSSVAAGKLFKVRFRVEGENRTISVKYIHFTDITVSTELPNGDAVPKNILTEKKDGKLTIVWQHPVSNYYTLTYACSSAAYPIGNLGVPFIAVNRFDAEDLAIYHDKYLKSISTYINQRAYRPTVETTLKLAIFVDDERISDQDIPSFLPNAWNTFVLDEPLLLDGQNLKFGIEVVTHDEKEHPIVADATRQQAIGKGDLYWDEGEKKWATLNEAGLINNWCIIGNVMDEADDAEAIDRGIVGYNIYKDGVRLNEDLIFGQSFQMDDEDGFLAIRAYSVQTGISAATEEWYNEKEESGGDNFVRNPQNNALKLYPNPVQDILWIKSESAVNGLAVYDISGRLILSVRNNDLKSLSTKDWKRGVYMIKVSAAEGETFHKVVKR